MQSTATAPGYTATTTPGVLKASLDPETLFDDWGVDYDLGAITIQIDEGEVGVTGPTAFDPAVLQTATSEYPDFGFHVDLDFFRTLAPYLDPTEEPMEVLSIQPPAETDTVEAEIVTYQVSPFRVSKQTPGGDTVEYTIDFDTMLLEDNLKDPAAYHVHSNGFTVTADARNGEQGFVFEWTECGVFDNHLGDYIHEDSLPDDYDPADYTTGLDSGACLSVPILEPETRNELEPGGYEGDARYELVFDLRACRDTYTNTLLATY